MSLHGRKTTQYVLGCGRVYGDPAVSNIVFIGFMGYAQLNVGFSVQVPSFLPFDVRLKKVSYTSIFANALEHSFAIYTHLGFPIVQVPTIILRTGAFTNAIVDDLDIPIPANTGLAHGVFNALPSGGLFSSTCSVLLERDFG